LVGTLGPENDAAITDSLRRSTFRPRATAVCWLVSLQFRVAGLADDAPADGEAFLRPLPHSEGAGPYHNVPPHLLDSARVGGDMPHLPTGIKRRLVKDGRSEA